MALQDGSVKGLATSLNKFREERNIIVAENPVIFADGCRKMSGFKPGFISEYEKLRGQPCLHVHCLCHSIEKLFSHIFTLYAGPTTGPASWSGGTKMHTKYVGFGCM